MALITSRNSIETCQARYGFYARYANQERRERDEKLNRVARISPANLTGAAPDERHFPQTVP
jgi:hypothetical protein